MPKLFYSPASPYARKVLAVAHETGRIEEIDLVRLATAPVAPNADLAAANPVAKIPTLVTDDAGTLFDSRVICEYLDATSKGARVFPAAGPARWKALVQQAAADGLLDAALLIRYELTLRPAEYLWQDWADGQMGKITAVLDRMEASAGELGPDATIGTIATGCALGYLDFRFADAPWRGTRLALAAWFAQFGARASMLSTRPEG